MRLSWLDFHSSQSNLNNICLEYFYQMALKLKLFYNFSAGREAASPWRHVSAWMNTSSENPDMSPT